MRKILYISLLLISSVIFSQDIKTPFKSGEWLKFKMSYSGFLKAGEAEMSLKKEVLNGEEVMHATGTGRTSYVLGMFFKVRDNYQSYFDLETGYPYLFKRNIREGGYKVKRDITFKGGKAYIKDYLKKKNTVRPAPNVHDLMSTFYHLRKYDVSKMKKGEAIDVDMFFGRKIFPFKLKFLGFDILKTKFGKIKTMKFMPIVKSGRVFKAKESVTVWITADDNKIPVKMMAALSVGSLRAELSDYKGLANPFKIISK